METSQKPVVNGLDSSPSASGYRHHLPQIPVMSKNPKIAQSKGSTKSGAVVNEHEHSTTDVEGVGKVVHIGSEVMEVDDSIDKMLDEFDKTNNDKDRIVENGTSEENKVGDNKTDEDAKSMEKNEPSVGNKTDSDKLVQDSKPVNEVDNRGEELAGAQQDSEVPVTDNSAAVSEIKPESITTPVVTKKSRRSKIKSTELDTSATMSSDESPVKRQRKPKVFEDENESVAKTPKSPVEKPVKTKPPPTPELEAKYPVKWLVGDLVWSKVAGHPWWPCMISYDPFTALYTRIARTRDYHVQFFGEAAERAWIPSSNLLEFLGKAKFDEHVEGVLAASKTAKETKRLKKWYLVPEYKLKAVNIGIAQAEQALKMDKRERRANYTFVYKIPKSKVSETVTAKLPELDEDLKIIHESYKEKSAASEPKSSKKRKLDEVETPKAEKTSAKRRKIGSPASTPKTDNQTKIGKKPGRHQTSTGSEGSFEVFCQKERDNVLVEHPEFTDDNLLDYCKQQWCMMSKKQKARYKSKFSEDPDSRKTNSKETDSSKTDEKPADLSQEMSPNSGRRRKPSKKVIEAEEDNKVADEVISGKTQGTPVATKPRKSTSTPKSTPKESKPKAAKTSLQKSEGTPSQAEETKVKAEPKKRGRPAKAKATTEEPTPIKTEPQEAEVTDITAKPDTSVKPETVVKTENDAKPGTSVSDAESEQSQTTTVIPAKRARPKKSVSIDSDKQSENGRFERSPSPEQTSPVKPVKKEYEYEMEIYKLSATGSSQKKENLCQICEQTGELVECTGPCQGFFHTDCLGLSTAPPESFKCHECISGIHTCFACKKPSAETQRCSVPVCGKFYHIDCVKKYSQAKVDGKSMTCPLHSCHTCLAYNLKGNASRSNGRLLRCVRCPTAYHVGDFCIAAGSINLTGLNIVCARHFQPSPNLNHHSRVHVSWCFGCNKGGTLLCCEYCPAAYHAECLNIEFPTGSWYCPDCSKGKQPLYGEIIWVKLGKYRWWPAEICHPRNVPLNIQERPHQVGEFPVHFLGSHEYFWLHQGRVFPYQDGDNGTTGMNSSKKGLAKHFAKVLTLGLKEAQAAFKSWQEFRENREQLELAKESKKPAPFRMVKTNVPLGSVVIKKADLSELPKCECKVDQENPCGRDSECLNSMMMYECHPSLCPVGEKCQNQFFTKRLYPPQQSYKTEGRGWGLKTMADIKKGAFVNEYVGDLIDEEECRRRLQKSHEEDVHNFYMMTLDNDRIIDAGPKGNLSRFMNHSCDPNLETQKWNVNGDVRVGLFALKDIKEGEELTFNYNFDCLGNEQTKCQCGSENCSGYLGVRPNKTQHAAMEEKKRKDAKKGDKLKKKKKPAKPNHEDDCFRCGEGGELMMCDRASCTKSYHLQCLNLSKTPYGKWDCPWHHCDVCGKPASTKCVDCPNSFCAAHSTENVKEVDGKIYCLEHEEETMSESRATPSDDNGGQTSDVDSMEKNEKSTTNGKKDADATDKNDKSNTNSKKDADATDKNEKSNTNGKKENESKKGKVKEETLPPKKRGPKPLSESGDKASNGAATKSGKSRRGSKAEGGGKGAVCDDPLAVAPMFDDDEDEEFGLVIDIPNF